MDADDLAGKLREFLHSRQAQEICRRYHTEPAEALGDLFLRLVRRIGQPIRKPKQWVKVNACGYLRNFLRRECCELRQTEEELRRAEIASEVVSELESEELRRWLQDALATLSPRERAALAWKAGLGGGSCRDVAKRLKVCAETVRNLAASAVEKLRPRLEGLL